mgnify:CR=1 FL=1
MSELLRLPVSPSVLEQRLEGRIAGVYNRYFKRLIGLLVAVPLLVVLSPVFALIAIAIMLDSRGPVFYRGERGGLNGRTFRIFKFRTMIPDAERVGGGTTALGDPRITRVGAFLRKTKMDEFPQLLNIIRGEMCFVGPRPELVRYTSQYSGSERYITLVRPGITDFSSIEFISLDEVVGSGDADDVYERKVLQRKNQLRIKYVEQMSPWTDLKLFGATVLHAFAKFFRQLFGQRRVSGTH